MSISLEAIVTGMNGGPEAIMRNFNKTKDEFERMNGSIVTIPGSQITALNGTNVSTNDMQVTIFKFNNFAILSVHSFFKITSKAWKYREIISVPKSYFSEYKKFEVFGSNVGEDDSFKKYSIDFDVARGIFSTYIRNNDMNDQGLYLNVVGILYN